MKLIKHQAQLSPYLDHYPNLVNGFLSGLIQDEHELKDILHPEMKIINLDYPLHSKKVMICGDYDCDGIISTTLLVKMYQALNIEVGYYIPNRLKEGYGTKLETIQLAHQKGYDTIVMVDNGVVNSSAHQYCQDHELLLIVIDHHQIPEPVHCDLLIHPDVLDEHFEGMCSSGLVYTLMKTLKLETAYDTVLAGIGTIGDMMSLHKQNRAIVKQALDLLNLSTYPQIASLLKKPVSWWDATTIAFQIVPVFNAIGRLADIGNVNTMVKYLLSEDAALISSYSSQLKALNQERKNLSQAHSQTALSQLRDESLFNILYNQHFHEGIIGIVASQMSNQTGKPTLVLSGDKVLKGSVRSNTMDVYTFLSQFSERYFLSFGGHQSACALSLFESDLISFRKEVEEAMKSVELIEPQLDVIQFEPEDLTRQGLMAMSDFEPFGQGFKPMDVYLEVIVIGSRKLGNAGYLLNILPVGEVSEILYFKTDLAIEKTNFRCGAIGSLQISNSDALSLIAQHLFML